MTSTAWQARDGLISVKGMAEREIRKVLRMVDPLGPAAKYDALMDLLPALVDQYGNLAVALAAEWYQEARLDAETRRQFDPVLATPPTRERFESLLNWALDMAGWEQLIVGGLGRTVADMHRVTITDSAIADPDAAGWIRVGRGETCDFCRVLLSRGAIYSDKTVTFKSHDNCNCVAAPAWDDPGRTVDTVAFEASKRHLSDETRRRNNQRVYDWIKANLA